MNENNANLIPNSLFIVAIEAMQGEYNRMKITIDIDEESEKFSDIA